MTATELKPFPPQLADVISKPEIWFYYDRASEFYDPNESIDGNWYLTVYYLDNKIQGGVHHKRDFIEKTGEDRRWSAKRCSAWLAQESVKPL